MAQFWTDRHGHEYFRATPEGRSPRTNDDYCRSKAIAHHRLLAYAWDMIDDPWNPDVEVDHDTEVPWLNAEWNLQPLSLPEHGRKTRRNHYRRTRR